MHLMPPLPLSRAVSPELEWRESCSSTNSDLVGRAARLPDLAVLATADQTAGRGRLGRVWSAPAGSALAVSVFVRLGHGVSQSVAADVSSGVSRQAGVQASDSRRLGWLPLIAGVAMVRAVRGLGVVGAGLKWPNDVLVDASKLSGILTELTPDGIVIGAGLNLTMTRADLPVLTATSLTLLGVSMSQGTPASQGTPDSPSLLTDAALLDRALAGYLRELFALVQQWRAVATPAELRPIVEAELQTLGRAVRVDRPGLVALFGSAVGLDDDGRLLVRPASPATAPNSTIAPSSAPAPNSAIAPNSATAPRQTLSDEGVIAVAAGDVTHLRYE